MTTPFSTPTSSTDPAHDDEAPAPARVTPSPPEEDPNSEQIRLTPWLVSLGIAAVVVGILTGLVMSQATLLR